MLLVPCPSPSLEHPQLCVTLSKGKVVMRHSHSPLMLNVCDSLLATDSNTCNVKVKLSLYGPGQANTAPRTFRQSAHKGGNIVSHTHRPTLFPQVSLVFIFLQTDLTPGKQCCRHRNRDLPACSAVPKPTAPRRADIIT